MWVEAEPNIFKRLQQNIEAVKKQPMGFVQRLLRFPKTEHVLIQSLVGEADGGHKEFHLYDNDGASNSVFQLNRELDHRHDHVKEVGQTLQLPVHRLDTLLEQSGVAPDSVDVLVIDIQGAELLCLARGHPRYCKPRGTWSWKCLSSLCMWGVLRWRNWRHCWGQWVSGAGRSCAGIT
ncbi:MAG: hypothetical protein HC898_03170 [Phycisphaerales bacterium]|nr:hypothetical protein [Phycisphaerales bacterium]